MTDTITQTIRVTNPMVSSGSLFRQIEALFEDPANETLVLQNATWAVPGWDMWQQTEAWCRMAGYSITKDKSEAVIRRLGS